MLPTQNGILESVSLIARMAAGAEKDLANAALGEFRKAHELMRGRLFILQVWRKYDNATADKVSRRKAGELLDPDLAKVIEENDKRDAKREREKDRAATQAKRFKGNPAVDSAAGPSGGHRGHSPRGRGGYSRGGRQSTPREERKCYVCGLPDHLARNCPKGSHIK